MRRNPAFPEGLKTSRLTFAQRVQRVNHQLENAVPHQAVVQGGRAAAPLEPGPGLGGGTGRQTRLWERGTHMPLVS